MLLFMANSILVALGLVVISFIVNMIAYIKSEKKIENGEDDDDSVFLVISTFFTMASVATLILLMFMTIIVWMCKL